MHAPHNPPYLISPRYLAGPDENATTAVAAQLLHSSWSSGPYGQGTVYSHHAPSCLLEAVHIPTTGDRPCPADGWEFTARPAPGAAYAWLVHFDQATPPELIAAFTGALTAADEDCANGDGPRCLATPGPPEEATGPLEAAGWIRDLAQYECAWYGPGQQAVVVTPLAPDEYGNGAASWLFAARRAIDNIALWYATAHPDTPTYLIHALCTALADPAPVPRQQRPGPEVGALTISRP
ncbi:DUF317 domain-containing protein [Streptomyces sp. TS71-3]|uniref:DUF317 domain-containing protein n=1 Tax=Streptomyces sp. TS71-3 TaxID=2733862 RepID=UPI001B19CA4B|nr:DUF317 domain-containing protein [Streptomyces sp. TS71-3]GHJ35451.1 hypothetical protein Sm713_10600 [Streptomyces sp. TS71-3]